VRINAQFVLLAVVLTIIALVQVLPQVDLPDTAFHEDTAPIVTKSRALSAPVAITIRPITPTSVFPMLTFFREPIEPSGLLGGTSRQALLSSFLC
jgi:hypothetical protein